MDELLTCPRCHCAMEKREHPKAVIDHCARCKGYFFDEGEMTPVLGKSADPERWGRASTALPEAAIACPRCRMSMSVYDVVGDGLDVEVDRCLACGGIWLDGGEVATVIKIGLQQIAAAERARDKVDGANASTEARDDEPGMRLLRRVYALLPND